MSVDHAAPTDCRPLAYLTADWHWPELQDRGPWAACAVGGDAAHALRQIVALCITAHADLFAAGDIFDGPDPSPESLAVLYATLRPLFHHGCTLYYILGNHDRGRDWLLPLGPTAIRLDGAVHDTPLGTATGVSYLHPSEFNKLTTPAVPTAVGLYHQTWIEFGKGGCTSLRKLPRHKLAVCGDVHVRSVVPSDGSGSDISLSPGPLTPQSVTEFGCGALTYAVGADLVPAPVKLTGRKFLYITLEGPADVEKALLAVRSVTPDADLPVDVASPFVSVRVDSTVDPAAVEAIRAAAAREGAIIRITSGRPSAAPTPSATLRPASSLADAIAGWTAVSDDVRRLAAAVVVADDPAAVLKARYRSSLK